MLLDTQLHDLASLTTIDAKHLDVAQFGADAIKEQKTANLKHSFSECTVLPEDQAQTMLAGVCAFFPHLNAHLLSIQRSAYLNARTKPSYNFLCYYR